MSAPYPISSDAVTPCRQLPDADLMFATRKSAPKKVEAAKKVCAPCPHVARCLEWALENAEEGVWGGTDEQDRVAIHRQRGTVGTRRTLNGLVRFGMESAKVPHGSSVGVDVHRRRYEDLCPLCAEFDRSRKGKTPPVKCPDCGRPLLPESLSKHRRLACSMRSVAS